MRTRFILLLFILSGSAVFAQKKLADKFYDNYGYAKAIELYEKVVEKGDSSQGYSAREYAFRAPSTFPGCHTWEITTVFLSSER